MDIVQYCLDLAPVPYLGTVFSVFRFVWSSVQQAQVSQQQLRALAFSIAQLLRTLDNQYRTGRLIKSRTTTALHDLSSLLREVSEFVQGQAQQNFLKTIFVKEERINMIEGFHRRISSSVTAFQYLLVVLGQVSAFLDIRDWQSRNDEARANDQRMLEERLGQLERNQGMLMNALNEQHSNVMAMMASLQKRLNERSDGDRQQRFYTHTMQLLSATSRIVQVELDSWTITSFDVNFGQEIGSGGFGQVFKGTWGTTPVALKVFKTEHGVSPDCRVVRHEIEVWSKLSHPHILQFLGANVLDDRPFIVMPYLGNGNARNYVLKYPDCNRITILRDMSRGLVYLHARKIIHGDIKGLNVLIDDSGAAVLCDFGLSKVRSDITSRTVSTGAPALVGSRNWMAPELLLRGMLRKPCDIYAFGMTIYEIYTNEVPLGYISYSEIIELVVRQDIRPERPDDEDDIPMPDLIWELAESCWVKDPAVRPTAAAVCDQLTRLLEPDVTTIPSSFSPAKSLESSMNSLSLSEQTLRMPSLAPTSSPPAKALSKSSLASSDQTLRVPHPPRVPSPSFRLRTPVAVRPPPPKSPRFVHKLTLDHHSHYTGSITISFSPDGTKIVSGSVDKTIRVWDVETGRLVSGPFGYHSGAVFSVAFSPCGRKIVSGGEDAQTFVSDAVTGNIILGPLRSHTKTITSVAFSPSGEWFASGSYDNTIQVCDARTGRAKNKPLTGHTRKVESLAFSPNGRTIASGSVDHTIRVWDVVNGQLVYGPLQGHTSWVMSVTFSPDGRTFASGSWDHSVRIWDAETGEIVSGAPEFKSTYITSVAFSPDGQWIAVGSREKMTKVFDVETGRFIGSARGHSDAVSSVAFSPDGTKLVSSSQDNSIRIFDIQ